jgi:hypothetical protein
MKPLILAAALSLSAQPDPSFMEPLRGAMQAMLASDYDQAEAQALIALDAAPDALSQYRVRHMLTDINARQADWDDAAMHAAAGRAILSEMGELPPGLAANEAHLAAEEWRGVTMAGEDGEMLTAHFVTLHPENTGWHAEVNTAVHDQIRCAMMEDGFLLFDIYEAPGCQYWSLDDFGLRVQYVDADDSPAAMEALLNAIPEARRSNWTELESADGVNMYERVFEHPAPTGVQRVVLGTRAHHGMIAAYMMRYPAADQDAARADLFALVDTLLAE